jgi:hypothetical protein
MDKLMASFLMASLLLGASITLLFFGCSNKNSEEACQHAVTMDLDKGNFDAVLASSCTDSMNRGAAYLGKAGFTAKNVINAFSQTGSDGTSQQSNLRIYMTSLIGRVDESSLTALDNAKTEYGTIPPSSIFYKDASFNLGLADVARALSLLKLVLDTDGSGVLSNACDKNNNGKPDELDASECALETSAGSSCTPVNTIVIADSPNILISNPTNTAQLYPGTYRGLVTTVSGTGTIISGCSTTNYTSLLYLKSAGPPAIWAPAPSAPGSACLGSDGLSWPCPIVRNSQPLDLVTSFDSSLTGAINAISTSLQPTSGTTTTTDVQTAIQNIKTDACPTGTCTVTDMAGYIQTY